MSGVLLPAVAGQIPLKITLLDDISEPGYRDGRLMLLVQPGPNIFLFEVTIIMANG